MGLESEPRAQWGQWAVKRDSGRIKIQECETSHFLHLSGYKVYSNGALELRDCTSSKCHQLTQHFYQFGHSNSLKPHL
jgi:hypothetical protein